MVIATNFEPPTEGIRHRETNTQALIRNKDLGKGTLYISETRLCWSGEGGTGFSLEYPAIQLHAVSRDTSVAPQPCLYLIVEGNLLDATSSNVGSLLQSTQHQCTSNSADGPASNGNGVASASIECIEDSEDGNDGSSSSNSSDQPTTEIRFIPPSEEPLSAMYTAMCQCSALHPDPHEQGDSEDEDGEEYDVEGAEQHLGIHPENNGSNQANEDEYMEGQFDDAD